MLHTGKSDDGYQILNADTLKLISTNFLEEKYFPIEIATIGIVKDENYVNGLELMGGVLDVELFLIPRNNTTLDLLVNLDGQVQPLPIS